MLITPEWLALFYVERLERVAWGPEMLLDAKDIGTRFDPPATADQLTSGQSLDGSDQPTLFSLLKGILLALVALNDDSSSTN